MKQQINPAVAAIVVAAVVLVVGFFVWRGTTVSPADKMNAPGMPPAVAAEFQKHAGSVTGPGHSATPQAMVGTGPTAPTAPGN